MQRLPDALAPLAAYQQFIVYKLSPDPHKPGKLKKQPADWRTGIVARGTEFLTDAQTAISAVSSLGSDYGVGFEFQASDPFWFLDIDGCLLPDETAWSPLALQLVAAFPGAAVEVSTSGKGLHIIGSGQAPHHGCRNKAYGLEFYTEKRFVALTGTHAVGSVLSDHTASLPSLVHQFFQPLSDSAESSADWTDGPCDEWKGSLDDEELLQRMLRSTSGAHAFNGKASFRDLFECNVEALVKTYPPDSASSATPYNASSADRALAQMLAFWTGKDCERIQRIMQRSALVRAKWDRDDYMEATILSAIGTCTTVLTDKDPEPVAGAPEIAAAASAMKGERAAAEMVTGSMYSGVPEQLGLFGGCVYVYDMNRVLVPGGLLLKQDQFRVMFGGYTFVMSNGNDRTIRDAYECFTQSPTYRSPRADSTCFKPDRAAGEVIRDAGRTRVNVWWPIDVPRQVGDAGPFLRHLEKLLPNERDREILMSYMCACVQHKGVKFQWAPLLQGVEGNGKTMLTRCVAEAIGKRYVHWPKASKLAKEFNAWMLNKLFYGVEDIYVPGNKRDVIEELKPMITGDDLEIEGKGVDQISADICGNFMFNSNHKDALVKTRKDRRFAIFYTPQQLEEDLARDGMTGDYFPKLYEWLRAGGYAIVSELLHTRPIRDEFNPATSCMRAPITTSTEEAISESLGRVEQEILEAAETLTPGFANGWVSSIALGNLLDGLGNASRIPLNKRRDLMAGLGYSYHPGLEGGRVNSNILPDGGKPRLYIKKDHPQRLLTGANVIAQAYTEAQKIDIDASVNKAA